MTESANIIEKQLHGICTTSGKNMRLLGMEESPARQQSIQETVADLPQAAMNSPQ